MFAKIAIFILVSFLGLVFYIMATEPYPAPEPASSLSTVDSVFVDSGVIRNLNMAWDRMPVYHVRVTHMGKAYEDSSKTGYYANLFSSGAPYVYIRHGGKVLYFPWGWVQVETWWTHPPIRPQKDIRAQEASGCSTGG